VISRARAARRPLALLLALLLGATLAACGGSDDDATASTKLDPKNPVTLTVGIPRNFGYLSTMWAKNVQVDGVKIEYKYFPNFVDMLTAFNGGKLDITEIGDVGAAQSYAASRGNINVVAVTQPNAENTGLLVPKNSPYKTFADLKGKKIVFLKSTNTYLGFKHQLAKAGLQESDFKIVELAGPAAVKAFTSGQVDGYYTIDPNLPDVVEKTGAREIANGVDMGIDNLYPYVAQKTVVEKKKAAVAAFVQALANTIAWAHANPDEQAKLVAPKIQFSESAIKTTYSRGSKALQPIDDAFYTRQQKITDELLKVGVLKTDVKVKDLYLSDFDANIEPSSDATAP
jgi:sulfonate transport system substrate-binding protein